MARSFSMMYNLMLCSWWAILLPSLAPSTSAINIINLNATDITTSSASFFWEVTDIEPMNGTSDLRTYVQLRYGLNFEVDSACLTVDIKETTFQKLQPYIAYFTCAEIVRLNDADRGECTVDSPRVSTGESCKSITTDFEPWSKTNLAAIGCSAGIVVVLAIAMLVEFKCPRNDMKDGVDRKKMREWSKKKRTESVRDFLEAVKVN